eukprot:1752825-Pleurochrysis_carterae.AAC.3
MQECRVLGEANSARAELQDAVDGQAGGENETVENRQSRSRKRARRRAGSGRRESAACRSARRRRWRAARLHLAHRVDESQKSRCWMRCSGERLNRSHAPRDRACVRIVRRAATFPVKALEDDAGVVSEAAHDLHRRAHTCAQKSDASEWLGRAETRLALAPRDESKLLSASMRGGDISGQAVHACQAGLASKPSAKPSSLPLLSQMVHAREALRTW